MSGDFGEAEVQLIDADGRLIPLTQVAFPIFSGVLAGLRSPQNAIGHGQRTLLTADFIGQEQRSNRALDPL